MPSEVRTTSIRITTKINSTIPDKYFIFNIYFLNFPFSKNNSLNPKSDEVINKNKNKQFINKTLFSNTYIAGYDM